MSSMRDGCPARRILCVGMCVLDIIHVCEQFPVEDTDKRCLSGYWQRGGNASNVSTVLSNLNADCEFLGMLSDSPAFAFLLEDCRQRSIKISNCPKTKQDPPFSSVVLVEGRDSRTIIHSNSNFPILTYDHFRQLNLDDYDWVHFEARNPAETRLMLNDIHEFNSKNKTERGPITISVELEKERVENLELAELADYVFLGKDLSKHLGWHDAKTAVFALRARLHRKPSIICTWGAAGSSCLGVNNEYDQKEAATPIAVVDALGAGDVFCAVAIYMLHAGRTLTQAIEAANIGAAHKLSVRGYDKLKSFNPLKLQTSNFKYV